MPKINFPKRTFGRWLYTDKMCETRHSNGSSASQRKTESSTLGLLSERFSFFFLFGTKQIPVYSLLISFCLSNISWELLSYINIYSLFFFSTIFCSHFHDWLEEESLIRWIQLKAWYTHLSLYSLVTFRFKNPLIFIRRKKVHSKCF